MSFSPRKTTQIPQFLLEDCTLRGEPCRLVATQPRRISAVSVADRVATERGQTLGESVAFKIRFEENKIIRFVETILIKFLLLLLVRHLFLLAMHLLLLVRHLFLLAMHLLLLVRHLLLVAMIRYKHMKRTNKMGQETTRGS